MTPRQLDLSILSITLGSCTAGVGATSIVPFTSLDSCPTLEGRAILMASDSSTTVSVCLCACLCCCCRGLCLRALLRR